MLLFTKFRVRIAAMMVVLMGFSGLASGQDKAAVLKEREATMKEQGKDLEKVKAYLEGKGELAPAKESATNLTTTTKKIPDLFPEGTGGPNPAGDYVAKPVIWSDWNKFLDAQKTAVTKANALAAALSSGDKAAIQAAYIDLGKNGCGACHTTFREKIEK